MLPYFVSYYGNPHSRTHAYGWQAEDAVELAREQVASLIKVTCIIVNVFATHNHFAYTNRIKRICFFVGES